MDKEIRKNKGNWERRISDEVDCVVFASDGEDSIRNAILNLVRTLKI